MTGELVTYDPLSPGFFGDPYPHYARLRAENPAHLTRFGFVVLTRYRQVVEAYGHPDLSRNTRLWTDFAAWRRGSTDGPLERMMANWLVMTDPPRHTTLRAIHSRVLTEERMTAAEGAVDKIVTELLDEGRSTGGMDLVGQFADRIPVYLINHLLDLPRTDWDRFVGWSRAIALTSEAQLTTKVLRAGNEALEGMRGYFQPLVSQRRAEPDDDVLSGLAVTEVDGVRMTDEELVDSLIFLYQAGHPTTTQLITLAAYSLLRQRDQLDRLRADRSLLPGAIEELQRYDGPVQMNDRVALKDMSLFGVDVRKGQIVRLCLGSANRDEERYPDADQLDVGRTGTDQLGYGHGLHHCVGAMLGRIQARIAIGALVDCAPGLRLTGDRIRFLPSAGNRGLVALPVEF